MSGVFLQRMVYGLLLVTLVSPASSLHVCRCASAVQDLPSATIPSLGTPLRACCAKRKAELAAKPQRKPGLKSRCCCDEIRWNRSIARIAVTRIPIGPFPLEIAFNDAGRTVSVNSTESCGTVHWPRLRPCPGESLLTLNCRQQV